MNRIRAYSTKPAAVLRLTGEDHADFLQSQGTADLRGSAGICRYSLWLDHKGLIHGDSFVLKISDEEMLLVSYETPAAGLMEKFKRHIIADDVEIEDLTDKWEILSIEADSVGHLFEDRRYNEINDNFKVESDGFVFAGRRLGPGSIDTLVPQGIETPLDIEHMALPEAETTRIKAGVLSIPRDILPGSFNPLEANLISPLSFDKGCYLGQEVVTRVHRLGRLSSRFISVTGSGAVPVVPLELLDAGRMVGALTSVVESHDKYFALGWLKSRFEDGLVSFSGHEFEVRTLPPS